MKTFISKIFHSFFYSFLPKIMTGSRADSVYSSTRVMLLGYSTSANCVSIFAAIVFAYFKQFNFLYYLVLAWIIGALYLATLLAFRAKDRGKIANNVINATEKIIISKIKK